MNILAIETSCDETAIAIVTGSGDDEHAKFTIRGNVLLSQVELHREYGGVFPALAKREHAKNLVPILEAALAEAEMLHENTQTISETIREMMSQILAREPGLEEQLLAFISENEIPDIDCIAVTAGPGLEPALWVGINFAWALSLAWDKPVVGVNHMEGHILAGLAQLTGNNISIENVQTPVLALLISGGHTELVLMQQWLIYKLIGQTMDDAVGEAFDKVARMLSLPYPGGPEISRLAESVRTMGDMTTETKALLKSFHLPRPMIDSDTCDFSFAGLKTAVLYLLKNRPALSDDEKKYLAFEFENAVSEVLWKKTSLALTRTDAKTLVMGGGVSANEHIRRTFSENMGREYPEIPLFIPPNSLTTDNAVMIALAGYYRALRHEFSHLDLLRANGNLSLA